MKRASSLEEIRDILRKHRAELKKDYRVRKLAVFGSYARGEATSESDLDMLVEFDEPPGFFRFLQLERHLSKLLGVPVELVTVEALKPHIGRHIMQEIVEV